MSTPFTEAISAAAREYDRLRQESQNEREELLRSLHERELELRAREAEVREWQQIATQHEGTIATQAETIAHLKRDNTHWRDQTSNWQGHFLRVEEQRCTLTSRMDELVSERVASTPTLPLTPVSRYDDRPPAAPVHQLKTPAKSRPPVVVIPPKQSATPKMPAESSAAPHRRPVAAKVIRRVQATYEVKTESDDDDNQLSCEEPPVANHHRRSRLVESDSDGEDEDEDEDELMIGPDNDTFPKPRRNVPPQPAVPPPAKKRKAINTKAGPAKKR